MTERNVNMKLWNEACLACIVEALKRGDTEWANFLRSMII